MHRIRILITDDDRMVIKLLRDTLEDEGYQTYIALDSAETIKAVEESLPDLIILDLVFPKIDGFEVCRQ